MPALNFKRQFMSAVLNGTKRQTIRATRKRPIKAGDLLHLYTGMRSKNCLRLRVARCTAVHDFKITGRAECWIDGQWLPLAETRALAEADGFPTSFAFVDFFRATHGLPFTGQLIKWSA